MRVRRGARVGTVLLLAALVLAVWMPTAAAGARIARIRVDGAINPAVADYVHEAIARAKRDGVVALVIELDTPGGLLASARDIVQDVLGAPVPVIVYVSPSGAGAGSAGVFITLAAHVAAMAPGTNIGAAHPVGGQGQDLPGAMGKKVESFTASFSEAIARQRGRNVAWAKKAVRKSVSVAAEEAVTLRVVDLVATDLADLLAKSTGREVDVGGTKRRLAFEGVVAEDGTVAVDDYAMRLAQQVLNVLADPNVAYLLLMAGLLGLYIELTHPGLGLPGVAGSICLLLALAALHVLPVNASGLALVLLGAVLLVVEAFLPSFGLIGAGGLVALLLGSLFLFDTANTGLAVARSLVFGVGGGLAAFMLVVSVLVVRSQRRTAALGVEGMVGAVGTARGALAPRGPVLVHGEYWTAESEEPIGAGEPVEVVEVRGLMLRVRRPPPGR